MLRFRREGRNDFNRFAHGSERLVRWLGLVVLCATVAWGQTQNPQELFHAALAAQRRGDDAAAIRNYQTLLKLRPDVMEVHANLGAVFAHAGRYGDAIKEYDEALRLKPENEAIELDLALAYYKQNDCEKASPLLAKLNGSHAEDVRPAVLLADCEVRSHQARRAVEILQKPLTANPDNVDLERAMSSALLAGGDLGEAFKLLQQLAQTSNDARDYLRAGQLALQLNQFERAKTDAQAAERLNPHLAGVETLKGQALSYVLDEDGAQSALELGLKDNPDDFDAHVTLAAILSSKRDLPNAMSHLKKALELRPKSTLVRYELGKTEQASGDLPAAVSDFEQVEHEDPNFLPSHVALTALYARLHKPEDAQRERKIVDDLNAKEQQKENPSSAPVPSH